MTMNHELVSVLNIYHRTVRNVFTISRPISKVIQDRLGFWNQIINFGFLISET